MHFWIITIKIKQDQQKRVGDILLQSTRYPNGMHLK